mgnify:CR=1 FL=1
MTIAYVLLAAGCASRFGGCKQLAQIDEKPLILHSLDVLRRVSNSEPNSEPFVVLGAYYDEISAVLGDSANIIKNEDWQQGLGSSIAKAVADIEAIGRFDAVLFTLADQIKVTEADLTDLIHAFEVKPITSAAFYGNKPGVPVLFPRSMFAKLKGLEGESGAKSLLMQSDNQLQTIKMDNAKFDIDYPEDLAKIRL